MTSNDGTTAIRERAIEAIVEAIMLRAEERKLSTSADVMRTRRQKAREYGEAIVDMMVSPDQAPTFLALHGEVRRGHLFAPPDAPEAWGVYAYPESDTEIPVLILVP